MPSVCNESAWWSLPEEAFLGEFGRIDLEKPCPPASGSVPCSLQGSWPRRTPPPRLDPTVGMVGTGIQPWPAIVAMFLSAQRFAFANPPAAEIAWSSMGPDCHGTVVRGPRPGAGHEHAVGSSRTSASPSSDALIFCFPYAGGSAAGYLDWQEDVGDVARLVAVRLPGRRAARRRGPRRPTLAAWADVTAGAITRYLDGDTHRPVVLFGHSFGALLAFETAPPPRPAAGPAAPGRLRLCGTLAAAQRLPALGRPGSTGGAFAEAVGRVRRRSGRRSSRTRTCRTCCCPDLRTDVVMMARYTYRPAPPLPAGVSLVNGAGRPVCGAHRARTRGRRECTSTAPPTTGSTAATSTSSSARRRSSTCCARW